MYARIANMPQFVDSVIIISIVKPTRCTNFSNIFYFGITLYMFRMVFPSIVRSSRLHTATGLCTVLNPDDGGSDHPKHVECYSKIKYI